MKKKCDCYKTIERLHYTPFYTQAYYETVGICNGTKEREECSCGGDRTKCNFYPEIREKAKKNVYIQDAINHFKYGISHDIFSESVTTYAKTAVEALEKQLRENQ